MKMTADLIRIAERIQRHFPTTRGVPPEILAAMVRRFFEVRSERAPREIGVRRAVRWLVDHRFDEMGF